MNNTVIEELKNKIVQTEEEIRQMESLNLERNSSVYPDTEINYYRGLKRGLEKALFIIEKEPQQVFLLTYKPA